MKKTTAASTAALADDYRRFTAPSDRETAHACRCGQDWADVPELTECADCASEMCPACLSQCADCFEPFCEAHLPPEGGRLVCRECREALGVDETPVPERELVLAA